MKCDPTIACCLDTSWNVEDWGKFALSYSDHTQNKASETVDSFISIGTQSRHDCVQSPPSFSDNLSAGPLRSMAVDLCTAREFAGALVSGVWHGVTTFGPRLDEIGTRLYSEDPATVATAVSDLLFVDIEVAGGLEMAGGVTSFVKGRLVPAQIPSPTGPFPGSGVGGFSSDGSIAAVMTSELSVEWALVSGVSIAGDATAALGGLCLYEGDGLGSTDPIEKPGRPDPFDMRNLTPEKAAKMFSRVAGKEVTVETLQKTLQGRIATGKFRFHWEEIQEWNISRLKWDGEKLTGEVKISLKGHSGPENAGPRVRFEVRFSNARQLRPGSKDPKDLIDTVGVEMVVPGSDLDVIQPSWSAGSEDLGPKDPPRRVIRWDDLGRRKPSGRPWSRQ